MNVRRKKPLSKNPIPALIPRDISWLSFNARVLQEAADPSVPLQERIKFLGIFSNNLDEFFRVRVAALRRMIQFGELARMHRETSPQRILDSIQETVLEQQQEFSKIWEDILVKMRRMGINLVRETELDQTQREFVDRFFEEQVRPNVIPLMIEDIKTFPYLREKSIYLAVVLSRKDRTLNRRFSLIEVPTQVLPRFVQLPSSTPGQHSIILLEDIIRHSFPHIFSFFRYDRFTAHVIKVTKDAEFDIDYDESSSYTDRIEKAVKSRRKGKPVRFVYDREIDPELLRYLIRRMGLARKDHLIPGGRIHNFRQFMDFPGQVFPEKLTRPAPIQHPDIPVDARVSDIILRKDVMLHPPYHTFNPLIDLLREAAIDPDVKSIRITAYRLARNSRIVNALINAARHGKKVIVVLELRARFDEENNLAWKKILEEEGVRVLVGVPNMKVHAKICLIRKKAGKRNLYYGFIGTGNLNEQTARVYGDHFLMTAKKEVMADLERIFQFLEKPDEGMALLKSCTNLFISPVHMRDRILKLIDHEISEAQKGRPASITLKLNALSDEELIARLHAAGIAGVSLRLIVRGIFCMPTGEQTYPIPVRAISIIDEYLEHARVMIFHHSGAEKVLISSSDWMVRNLDHRVEVAVSIDDPGIAKEIREMIEIQLKDNVKARLLDDQLENVYVRNNGRKIRSQRQIHDFLSRKGTKNKK
jgi:polyphosphate kinase